MTVGILMLVHAALERAAEVARHWARHDCPVVIHVDRKVPPQQFEAFKSSLADLPDVLFLRTYACEWGTWSLVAASQDAAELMLNRFPDVRHVMLTSGSCLPIRPVQELEQFLDAHPTTDFIESVTTEDVPWTVGGLDIERFTLRFPFSWKSQRRLFDRYVRLQRKVGFSRRIPARVTPHLGSQWWCLTRNTLDAILHDPDRPQIDAYFRKVWIPDESYFQSLVRCHSDRVESHSLTLSKFDFQGRPYIFYDDHLAILRRSDRFVARKIWANADGLYETFLGKGGDTPTKIAPNPARVERMFAKAAQKRLVGRTGLVSQSRFPNVSYASVRSAADYSVFWGFSDLYEDFETWLGEAVGARVHGHLFARGGAEFSGGQDVFTGALSSNAKVRDYKPEAFLSALLWNTRGEQQCFMHGPGDRQKINWHLVSDSRAQISVITGAWAIPLFHANKSPEDCRSEAARLQRVEVEAKALKLLRQPDVRARIRIWSLAYYLSNRLFPLQAVVDEIAPRGIKRALDMPVARDLTGFETFLQGLRNGGMNPYLAGEFSAQQTLLTPQRPTKIKEKT